jgi:hypothetical protein
MVRNRQDERVWLNHRVVLERDRQRSDRHTSALPNFLDSFIVVSNAGAIDAPSRAERALLIQLITHSRALGVRAPGVELAPLLSKFRGDPSRTRSRLEE